jgi:hypothetical protein
VRQFWQTPKPVAVPPGPVGRFHTARWRVPVGAAAATLTDTWSSVSESTVTELTVTPPFSVKASAVA